MGNEELSRLRAIAKAKHKRASAKVSRIRNSANPVEIAGSKYDPRREISKIDRYNSRQLSVYIKKLETFNSRTTQFVGDSKYRPIPKSKWDVYKKAEAEMNKRKEQAFNAIKHLRMPPVDKHTPGTTIEEFEKRTRPVNMSMLNPAVNNAYHQVNRRSRSVPSEKALRKLIRNVKQSYTTRDIRRRVSEGKDVARRMLDIVGDSDLRDALDNLTDKQFNTLWTYSGKFAANLSLQYELAKHQLTDKDSLENDATSLISKQAHSETKKLAKWAKTL